ncbi:hypothetical protein EIN_275850, partial [Entamoeba invadens IP1]
MLLLTLLLFALNAHGLYIMSSDLTVEFHASLVDRCYKGRQHYYKYTLSRDWKTAHKHTGDSCTTLTHDTTLTSGFIVRERLPVFSTSKTYYYNSDRCLAEHLA